MAQKTAASWTKEKIDFELKELKQGMKEAEDLDSSMAFEIAESWINENPGVELAIQKHYPTVTDFQGFVANRI